MHARTHFLWSVIWPLISVFPLAHADDNEYRLMKYLMADYDPSVRPAINSTQPLEVRFGISLHNIIDVDEKNQILTTNCWLTQTWNDTHLQWNASDFGGLDVVRIPYLRVWKPDVILYNNADSQFNQAVINTNVIVRSDGSVTWLSHGIFRSSCDINVEYFPFDVQSCKMKWASWTYDGYQLNLLQLSELGDITNYQPNGEFDLITFEPERHEQFYSCCPEPYPDITYTIRMKRRPLFYVFNLILPCILINSIALLVFYVPSESGEKVTLGISALLSMTVFLMTIRESLPPTEKTPLISLYYGVSICLVSFASGMAVVTLNIHHRGLRGLAVPNLLKNFVLDWVAKVLMLKFGEEKDEKEENLHVPPVTDTSSLGFQQSYNLPNLNNICERMNQVRRRKKPAKKCVCNARKYATAQNGVTICHCVAKGTIREDITTLEGSLQKNNVSIQLDSRRTEKFCSDLELGGMPVTSPRFGPKRRSSQSDEFETRVSGLLLRVASAIERSEARMAKQDVHEAVQLEWKKVALVCDRSLLIIFFLTTAVATCVILFSSPYGP